MRKIHQYYINLLGIGSRRPLHKESHLSLKKSKLKPPWDVLFFGTDDFALKSLVALHRGKDLGLIGKLDVVTTALKKISPVQKFCKKQCLDILHWPLEVPRGIYDVGTVVSFGHLIPSSIINAFPYGMLNVHGSLLPRWRGAAPVMHALLHNDQVTGITVMEIQPHRFDIGRIVSQASMKIPWDAKSSNLTAELAMLGAQELIKVMETLPESLEKASPQPPTGVCKAPKVTETDSRIQWATQSCQDIQAHYRALDDHFPLWTTWQGVPVKLRAMEMHTEWSLPMTRYNLEKKRLKKQDSTQYSVHIQQNFDEDKFKENINTECNLDKRKTNIIEERPGMVSYNKLSRTLNIKCSNGWVSFSRIVLKNKRPMTPHEFYNGFIGKVDMNMRVFL